MEHKWKYRQQPIDGIYGVLEITFLAVYGRGRPRKVVGECGSALMESDLPRVIQGCERDAKFKLLKARNDDTDSMAFYQVELDVELQAISHTFRYKIRKDDLKRVNYRGKYYNAIIDKTTGEVTRVNRWSSKVDLTDLIEEPLTDEVEIKQKMDRDLFVSRFR